MPFLLDGRRPDRKNPLRQRDMTALHDRAGQDRKLSTAIRAVKQAGDGAAVPSSDAPEPTPSERGACRRNVGRKRLMASAPPQATRGPSLRRGTRGRWSRTHGEASFLGSSYLTRFALSKG